MEHKVGRGDSVGIRLKVWGLLNCIEDLDLGSGELPVVYSKGNGLIRFLF